MYTNTLTTYTVRLWGCTFYGRCMQSSAHFYSTHYDSGAAVLVFDDQLAYSRGSSPIQLYGLSPRQKLRSHEHRVNSLVRKLACPGPAQRLLRLSNVDHCTCRVSSKVQWLLGMLNFSCGRTAVLFSIVTRGIDRGPARSAKECAAGSMWSLHTASPGRRLAFVLSLNNP